MTTLLAILNCECGSGLLQSALSGCSHNSISYLQPVAIVPEPSRCHWQRLRAPVIFAELICTLCGTWNCHWLQSRAALNGSTSTVLVKTAPWISLGIGARTPGESEKAIRYGNFVVHTAYAHTRGHTWTHTRAAIRTGPTLQWWRGLERDRVKRAL